MAKKVQATHGNNGEEVLNDAAQFVELDGLGDELVLAGFEAAYEVRIENGNAERGDRGSAASRAKRAPEKVVKGWR